MVPLSMLAGVDRLDYEMSGWTLLGPPSVGVNRKFVREVTFQREFSQPPIVHLGIVGFDISNQDFSRLKVRPAAILPSGFSIVAETWFDTQIFGVDISWLAVGI